MNMIESFKNKTGFTDLNNLFINDVDYFISEVNNFLTESKLVIEKLELINKSNITWNNSFQKIANLTNYLSYLSKICSFNCEVFFNELTEDKLLKCSLDIDNFEEAYIRNNNKLISLMKVLKTTALSVEKNTILTTWISSFFENNKNKRITKEASKINKKLVKLSNQFLKNIKNASLDYTTFIPSTNKKLISQLPKEIVEYAKECANELGKDGLVIYCDEFMLNEILTKCPNRQLRFKVYQSHQKLNSEKHMLFNNDEILKEILQNKQKEAQLYKFKNYTDLVLSNYVLNDVKKVKTYLDNITIQLDPYYNNLMDQIKDLALKDGLKVLQKWDTPYYLNQLKAKYLNKTENDFAEYFSWNTFLPKCINLLSEQFEIKFTEITEHPLIEQDNKIKIFHGKDLNSSRESYFIIDPYNVSRKRGTFFYNDDLRFINPIDNNKSSTGITYISCDLDCVDNVKLSFDTIRCFLHEFGHALHTFFASKKDSLCGVNKTSWDLIEVPSQFVEFWVYEPKILKKLSQHSETKKQISNMLVKETIEKKEFFKSYELHCDIKRYEAKIRLFHEFKPYSQKNPKLLISKMLENHSEIFNLSRDFYQSYTNFGSEYSASEFVYLFSAGLSFQLYSNWKDSNGVNNPKVAQYVFKNILNTEITNSYKNNLGKYVNFNDINILSFLDKKLNINLYGKN